MSPNPTRRNWNRWLVGGVVVVILLVVGGPFVYIHFIEGKAPAPLSVSSLTTTTVAGQPVSTSAAGSATLSPTIDGTWKVAAGSIARYRIKETLFGQSNTAIGSTSAVTGSIAITGTTVATGSLSVDMTKVSSNRSQRDGQFQGRIMDTATY